MLGDPKKTIRVPNSLGQKILLKNDRRHDRVRDVRASERTVLNRKAEERRAQNALFSYSIGEDWDTNPSIYRVS